MQQQIRLKNLLLITVVIAVFLSVSLQSSAQGNFINVAGTWRYDNHDGWTRTRASVNVSQATNGKVLAMSGTVSYHHGWDNFDWEVSNTWQCENPVGHNSYSGEYDWNLMIRYRLGWGFGSIWNEGPFPASGSVSFTPESEETASFQLSGPGSYGSKNVASYTQFGSDLVRVTRDPLVEVEEDEEVLVSVSASPKTILIDRAGVSSGITFTATTLEPCTVSFKVKGPDTSIFNVGSQASAGAPGNCKASILWPGSPDLSTGNYEVIAEVSAQAKTAPFKVGRANVDFAGIGLDLGSDNKNPTISAPPSPPAKDKCPPPYGLLPTALSGHPGGISVADPVNIVSGNFFLSETDIRLKSRIPLQLTRNYNSIVKDKTLFGRGWSSLFSTKLILSDSHIVFVNADGSRILFLATGDTYTPTAGHDAKLTHFDSTGLWSVAVPQGNEWFFDADGKILRMVQACCGGGASDSVDFEYDENGFLSKVINPAGQSLQFTYTGDLVTTITDSSGRICSYSYNENNDLLSFTDPYNRLTTYSYDELGFLTKIVKPGNITTAIEYAEGKASKITNPDESTNAFTWDTENKTTILTDGTGVDHIYTFNDNWQFANYSVPSVGLTTSLFLSQSAVTGKTDSLGNSSFYQYDAKGYLTAITDPTGFVTTYGWHPILKKLTSKTDALGRSWSYEWCDRGNLVSETDPAGNSTSYAYDSHNNRTAKTDALGRKTRYIYDATGNYLLQTVDAMGGVANFSYDTRGNRIRMTDESGKLTSYSYDNSNWLTQVVYPNADVVAYAYNGAGDRLTEQINDEEAMIYEYDSAGRMLSKGDESFSYDVDGNMLTDAVASYTWNSDNRLIKVEKTIEGCKHDKGRKGHGHGHLKHDKESVVYEEYTYLPQDWRRVMRKTGKYSVKTDRKGGSKKDDEEEQIFVSIYDGDDESHEYLLTKSKFKFHDKRKPKKESLKLIREFIGGPAADDIAHTRYGRLSFAMLKDALGSTIVLTGRNGKAIAHIAYDAWGNFRYENKPGKSPCKDDDFDNYLNRLEGTRGFGHSKHNSHAFGQHFGSKLTPYLYTGRRYSSFTTQHFNRNRYYSPSLGRFTTKDPIGFNGGMNLYRYADNNPVIYTDPSGLAGCYKDLVINIRNYYDIDAFAYNIMVVRRAFQFLADIPAPNTPALIINPTRLSGQKTKLGTIDGFWTPPTVAAFNAFSVLDNSDKKFANILVAATLWGSEKGVPAGQIVGGTNRALVSGNYYAHSDPSMLAWTIAHETGHILSLSDNPNVFFGLTMMSQGHWEQTDFSISEQDDILGALKK